jgi:hypothetical protein
MALQPSPVNRVWFTFFFHDPDLVHLARAVLNVEAARQLAGQLDLAVEEEVIDDFREFAVLVPTAKLAEVIVEYQNARIPLGVVDCCDSEAFALCRQFELECELIDPLA